MVPNFEDGGIYYGNDDVVMNSGFAERNNNLVTCYTLSTFIDSFFCTMFFAS
jgi:hypothetical protein